MEHEAPTEGFEERLAELLDAPCETGAALGVVNEGLAGLLERVKTAALDLLNRLENNHFSQEASPMDEAFFTFIQDSEPASPVKRHGDKAPFSEKDMAPGSARHKLAISKEMADAGADDFALEEPHPLPSFRLILDALPVIRLYGVERPRGWDELLALAEKMRAGLQVNGDTWARAVAAMGRERAALSLLYTLHLRDAERLKNARNAGAYFNRLITLYDKGAYEPLAALQSAARMNMACPPGYL